MPKSARPAEPMISGLIDIPQHEARLLLEAGYFYMQLNKLKEAAEVFEGVESLIPHSEVPCLGLCDVLVRQNKLMPAYKVLEVGLKRQPNSTAVLAYMGEVLLLQKKFEQATSVLNKAIEIEPKSPGAIFAAELLKGHALKVFN